MSDKEIKTTFRGPGEWRSQAAELERQSQTEETEEIKDSPLVSD